MTRLDVRKFKPMLLTAGNLQTLILCEDTEKFLQYLKFLQVMAKEITISQKQASLKEYIARNKTA
jgi:glutaredoxin-related protein